MERNFDFDFSNKTIEYCFIKENFKQCEYKLDDIVTKATNSIIIYDTNEFTLAFNSPSICASMFNKSFDNSKKSLEHLEKPRV